ncbi:MAG: hypothetical protein H7257_07960 [Taibaiella sp.]|nr:hypothetical protein [Taibaiella sp.]
MKRVCEKVVQSHDGKVSICIDTLNKDEILKYILQDERHKKIWTFIAEIILGRYQNREVYDKEEINSKCRHVTAMKFFKGQENDRIYCKEVRGIEGVMIVVAAVLHKRKKSTGLSQREITIIETVGGYDYEIQ